MRKYFLATELFFFLIKAVSSITAEIASFYPAPCQPLYIAPTLGCVPFPKDGPMALRILSTRPGRVLSASFREVRACSSSGSLHAPLPSAVHTLTARPVRAGSGDTLSAARGEESSEERDGA